MHQLSRISATLGSGRFVGAFSLSPGSEISLCHAETLTDSCCGYEDF
jgi:hypothetical protein